MTDSLLENLPAAPSLSDTDLFYVKSGTTNYKATGLQVKNYTVGGAYWAAGTNPDDIYNTNTRNVGIGTPDAVAKLHISNEGAAVSSALYTTDLQVISSNGASPGFNIIAASATPTSRGVFKATRARGDVTTPTSVASGDYTFSLLGAAYDGTSNLPTASVTFLLDGTVSTGVAPQSIIFETGATNTRAERVRIKPDGRVGFGTTAPDRQVEINSATGACLRLTYNDSNGSATNYADFTISSAGDLTIQASGGDINFDNENLLTTGTCTVGDVNSSNPQLIVNGGASGGDLVRLNRTVGAPISFGWGLGGGGLTFTDRTASVTVVGVYGSFGRKQIAFGVLGQTVSDVIPCEISATGFGPTAGTDVPGVPFYITGSKGTGAGAVSDVSIWTANALASGTTQQTASQRVTIKGGTGFVGIGTNNPLNLLHVSGSVGVISIDDTGAAGTPGAGVVFRRSTVQKWLLQCDSGSTSTDQLDFLSAAGGIVSILQDGKTGWATRSPTHTLTVASAQNGIALYNTADQTTNYERVVFDWLSTTNVFTIATGAGGTGTYRPIQMTANAASSGFVTLKLDRLATPFLNLSHSGSGLTGSLSRFQMNGFASSGNQTGFEVSSTWAQTGTASYTGLRVSVTETSTGSGAKKPIDVEVGGATKWSILNTGVMQYIAGNTATTVGAAGAAAALPATPDGYFLIDIGGTNYKVPYYAS